MIGKHLGDGVLQGGEVVLRNTNIRETKVLEMVVGEDVRQTKVLEMVLRESGELVGGTVCTGGSDVWEVADCGCEGTKNAESEDDEDQEAEAVGPDVDGVVVEREEGGAEAGA